MLNNTFYRLKQNKKLSIGYFGGSITEGGSASDSSKTSYRALVTDWFRQQFPDAEIQEIQAAISATGTQLGMHRCENDLLCKEPDLIFMEYAANDYGLPYEKVCAQFETILQKIYAKNPFADVIVLTSITADICSSLEKGEEFVSRNAHIAVAHHYRIPIIDVGTGLWAEIMRTGGDFLRYTTDTIHPNDAGYRLYTQTICGFLSKWLMEDETEELTAVVLPKKSFCDKLHMKARMIDCTQLDGLEIDGFVVSGKSLCGRYPRYIESSTPGDSFSFSFTGENAGFYWVMGNDSGDVLVSVDGGEEKTVSSWDKYCPNETRAGYAFFAENLEYGVHNVVVRVAETKAEKSEGTVIRIGAILIS